MPLPIYKYKINSNGTIEFTTDQSLKYLVYFREKPGYFYLFPDVEEYIYDFGFEVAIPINQPMRLDKKISNTISAIVHQFLQNNERALYFICHSEDKKHLSRRRLFANWYKTLNVGLIEMHDFSMIDEDNSIYGSIMFQNDCPHKERILEVFNLVQEDLFTK